MSGITSGRGVAIHQAGLVTEVTDRVRVFSIPSSGDPTVLYRVTALIVDGVPYPGGADCSCPATKRCKHITAAELYARSTPRPEPAA